MEKKDFKIFVVDDSDLARTHVVKTLESEDFNVIGEASSAKQALEQGLPLSPHLMITDIVMPDTSGIELCKTLKDNPQRDKVSVIVMSSLTAEHIIIEAISAGAKDFLKKPISKNELVAAVEKVFIQLTEDA